MVRRVIDYAVCGFPGCRWSVEHKNNMPAYAGWLYGD